MGTTTTDLDTIVTGFAVLRTICEMEGLSYEVYDSTGHYLIVHSYDGTRYFVGTTFRYPKAESNSYHVGKNMFDAVKATAEQMGARPAAGFVVINPTAKTADVLIVPADELDTTKENGDAVYFTDDGTIRYSPANKANGGRLPDTTLLFGSLSFQMQTNKLK